MRSMERIETVCVALALVGLGALAGCGEDFTPPSVIEKTRILGMRASEPRLSVGESTRLSALVVTAEEGDPIERTWELCPFTESEATKYACAYPPELPPQALELLRGRAATFDFVYLPQLVELVDFFCEQQAELVEQLPPGIPLPDCSSGFPARVRLSAVNTATGEEAIAVKTLYLAPSQPPPDYDDNANPRIAELVPVEPQAPLQADGEDFELRCNIDRDSLESFVRSHDDEARLEEIQLSWYVRNGRLDESTTFFSTALGDPEEAQSNTLTVEEAGPVTVWCVIRDGRGGADWQRLDLEAR